MKQTSRKRSHGILALALTVGLMQPVTGVAQTAPVTAYLSFISKLVPDAIQQHDAVLSPLGGTLHIDYLVEGIILFILEWPVARIDDALHFKSARGTGK